MTDSLYVE